MAAARVFSVEFRSPHQSVPHLLVPHLPKTRLFRALTGKSQSRLVRAHLVNRAVRGQQGSHGPATD
jgi:hypothetical protein